MLTPSRLSSVVFLLAAACGEPGSTPAADGPLPAHIPTLEVFVMSQCPYGVQVEQALEPVREKLGAAVDLQIEYIGQGEPGAFSSLHGPNEVKGNIAQLCAREQMDGDAMPFIACQNEDMKAVHTNWTACGEELGLDVAALTACVDGDHGQELLAASFALAQEKGAKGSPTMFLDGEPYQGGRKPTDFLRAMCGTYGDDAPQACSELPEPVKVDAVFFSDARCEECDLHKVEPRLKGELPGLQVTYVDFMSDDGRRLYKELQAADPEFKLLPTVLLSPNVDEEEGFANLKRFTRELGDHVELRMGGKFDPLAEICDNEMDDDGDGAADCADSGCANQLVCREPKENSLDMYVMSQCPYGAKALIAAEQVVREMGDIDLTVHFIGNEVGGELTSMHGPAEVEHDIREACAQDLYPEETQFLKYMACFSRDYKNGDWKACAREAEMDVARLDRCYEGQGKSLVAASFAGTNELGIGSSPTFLSNNRRTFNAITAPDLQRQFCTDNPSHAGCANVVLPDAADAAPVPAGECE
jgi:glutaredoxin